MHKAIILLAFLVFTGIVVPEALTFPSEPVEIDRESDANKESPPSLAHQDRMVQPNGKLPLYFIENRGQMDKTVSYFIEGADKTLYFTDAGITIALSTGNDEIHRWTLKQDFIDANPDVELRGESQQQAVFSYFKGKAEEWRTGISTYAQLVYQDLWPGIDLVYTGTVNRLKYEFRVAPGADPNQIRLRYRGAEEVSIKDSGELIVMTRGGTLEDGKPYAYQTIDGADVEVIMTYALMDNPMSDSSYVYGFKIGDYDHSKPLVLDPVVLVYCGYIGGSGVDRGGNVAVDDQGNSYIVGSCDLDSHDFPVTVGPDTTLNGLTDVFVAKVNPQGTDLVYCGYIGGSNYDFGGGIAVDSQGNAYVTGDTGSSEFEGFPLLVGPDLSHNGEYDAFIAKVNPQGTALEYCGYLGGDNNESANDLAIDHQGNAYVAGWTGSSETFFPVVNGPGLTFEGSVDAFVAKVNSQGTALDYCGYIGGTDSDRGYSIAVDGQDNAYVVGFTTSSQQEGFPVRVGPDITHNGYYDAFVAKVNTQGTGLEYCGYIGGTETDKGYGVAVDSQGNAYVAGFTDSMESEGFPAIVGPDLTHNGYYDAFLAKVNSVGSALDYCGFIGGSGGDYGFDIAVDGRGNAYMTGDTDSTESSFPVSLGPDLTFNGEKDIFVVKVSVNGGVDYCGYIGGDEEERGDSIVLDNQGFVYLTGWTESTETSFPVTVGPDLTFNFNSDYPPADAFVAKIAMALETDQSSLSAATGGTVHLSLHASEENAGRTFLVLGTTSGTEPGILLPGGLKTLPINWDWFTDFVIDRINTPHFSGFFGSLDDAGSGSAQITVRPLNVKHIGKTMHYAFMLNDPFDFVSNPVAIEVVP